jgi:hypothetical protein
MKPTDIQAGAIYYDGKHGIRKVLACDDASGSVSYQILAAKQESKFDFAAARAMPVVGTRAKMQRSSFAAWAHEEVSPKDLEALVLVLTASKLKLAPGEKVFMDSLAQEGTQLAPGTHISYNQAEIRTVNALARKGFLSKLGDLEIKLSPLGAAWLKVHHESTGSIATN